MKVNLVGVSSEGFQPLPRGKYEGFIYEAEEGEVQNGKNKGAPMLSLTLKVSDEDDEYAGRQAWINHPFVDGALPFLKMTLIALGEDPTELDNDDVDFEPQDFVGRAVVFECGEPREYRGEKRTSVKRLWPEGTPLTADEEESVSKLVDSL